MPTSGHGSFDRVADRYDTTRGRGARGERLAADLHRWLVPGTVLEVGVGTALVAAALAERGHLVFGVDAAQAMLAQASTRLPGRLVRGDALALPVGTGTVGNVVFVAVLHLLPDLSRALVEAARVLVPGGRVGIVHGLPHRDPNDIEDALRPLARLRAARRDTEFAITAGARAARLRPVADTMTGRIPWAESPDEVADRIEERVWSFLWRVTDATWEREVVPAIDLLRNLPRPTHPRPRAERFALSVYERPAPEQSR